MTPSERMISYDLPGLLAAATTGTLGLAALALGAAAGRAPPGRRTLLAARSLVLLAAVLAPLATQAEPPGTRMLLVCGAVFLAFKALVIVEARRASRAVPQGAAWIAFALLWPGMRPWAFVERRSTPRRARVWMLRGLGFLVLGTVVLLAARSFLHRGPPDLLVAALALAGVGLVLAFGLFQVLAGAWRALGRGVAPLFDAPADARTLEEFWGRRWNLAFSEMLQLSLTRPLKRAGWPRLAQHATFVVSGLLHELALSVPARGGYGLPTLYFLLQAVGVATEGRGARGAAWRRVRAWMWVLLPAPLLFHPPALRALVLPILHPWA